MVQALTNRPQTISSELGWTVEGASPELLLGLLEEYQRALHRAGFESRDWLEPGIDRDQVRSVLAPTGLEAPDELLVWYAWQNGPRRHADGTIFATLPLSFLPAPLAWSANAYRRQMDEWVPAGLWDRGWLTLQDHRGLSVYCGAEPSAPCLVRMQSVEDYDFVTEYRPYQVVSLCTVVTWWLEALETNAAWFDPETMGWQFDGQKCAEIDHGTLILS